MSDGQITLNMAEPMHRFARLVLAEPKLQARLAAILEPERFEAEAAAIAAEHSIPLPDDVLRAAFPPDPAGVSRWLAPPVEMTCWPGNDWIAGRSAEGTEIGFDWTWLGDSKTDAPLFEMAIRKASTFPFNRMFRIRTSLQTIIDGAPRADSIAPSGFIFHMSRCGSTLVARMLGAARTNLVASEPEPVDAVLLWAERSDAPHDRKIAAIRAVVAAIARKRDADWSRFFIKFDAWHMLSFRLLREAFPDVPWIFLYREPIEVLVSLSSQPGIQTVPGLLPTNLVDIENPEAMPQEEYTARLLDKICDAAITHHSEGNGLIIDYRDLPDAALGQIVRHFGFVPDDEDIAAMRDMTRQHSKTPTEAFSPDSRNKQASASAEMRELANRVMHATHERLRQISGMTTIAC